MIFPGYESPCSIRSHVANLLVVVESEISSGNIGSGSDYALISSLGEEKNLIGTSLSRVMENGSR
jgi:hypothetical protein